MGRGRKKPLTMAFTAVLNQLRKSRKKRLKKTLKPIRKCAESQKWDSGQVSTMPGAVDRSRVSFSNPSQQGSGEGSGTFGGLGDPSLGGESESTGSGPLGFERATVRVDPMQPRTHGFMQAGRFRWATNHGITAR